MATKSYRSVPMVSPDAMISAAAYLTREWGENRGIGYVGEWPDSFGRWHSVFQCSASDGSRWLIRSDSYGNVGTFDPELEREVGAALDVEVS